MMGGPVEGVGGRNGANCRTERRAPVARQELRHQPPGSPDEARAMFPRTYVTVLQ